MIDAIKKFWAEHVQKTLSVLLGGAAVTDLLAGMAGYESEISTLIGVKFYAGIRVALAAVIFWRATHKPQPLPAPAPAATR